MTTKKAVKSPKLNPYADRIEVFRENFVTKGKILPRPYAGEPWASPPLRCSHALVRGLHLAIARRNKSHSRGKQSTSD